MKDEKQPLIDHDDDFDDLEDIEGSKYLTFVVNKENYGIPILDVVEIIRMIKITSIPDSIRGMKGIVNLRGSVIPILDVRVRFSLPEKEADDRTCILVVKINESTFGLIVDEVSEVIHFQDDEIEALDHAGLSKKQQFIEQIGKKEQGVYLLLELSKLLLIDEQEAISSKVSGRQTA